MLKIAELNIALYHPLLNLNTLAVSTIVIWKLHATLQGGFLTNSVSHAKKKKKVHKRN